MLYYYYFLENSMIVINDCRKKIYILYIYIYKKGTPIQNNIGELHSLLQFQNPQIFNMKEKVFLKLFPSLSDTVELQSIMKP